MMSAKMRCASFLGLAGWVFFHLWRARRSVSSCLDACHEQLLIAEKLEKYQTLAFCEQCDSKHNDFFEGLISFEDSGKTLQSCIWPSGMKSGSAWISLTGLKVDKSAHYKDRRLESGCTSAEYLIPLVSIPLSSKCPRFVDRAMFTSFFKSFSSCLIIFRSKLSPSLSMFWVAGLNLYMSGYPFMMLGKPSRLKWLI